MLTTFHTINFRNREIRVPDEHLEGMPADILKTWTFTHEEYTAGDELAVGKRVQDLKIADSQAFTVARGAAIIEKIVTSWERPDASVKLPVTFENALTLPKEIVERFGLQMEYGIAPSVEEWAEIKKPTKSSTTK